MRRFWKRVHQQAWGDARQYVRTRLGYAVFVLVVLLAVVSGVRLFGTSDGWIDDLVGALVWVGAMAIVFGWLYVRNFASIAPQLYGRMMEQWRKGQARIAGLERDFVPPSRVAELEREIGRQQSDAQPRIRFGELSQDAAEDMSGREVVFSSYVGVHNSGNEILERCLVKVERIQTDEAGPPREIQGALTTKARHEDGQVGGPFTLRADERKRVLLTIRDATNPRMPGAHKITFENLEFPIYRGHFCIVDLIAVADAGKADRMRVRLSVDDEYNLTSEQLPLSGSLSGASPSAQPPPNSQSGAAAPRPTEIVLRDRKADIAKALDEFFAEGVVERNRLTRPVPDFEYAAERQRLVDWSDRAVEKLQSEFVNAGERSRFKTLDRYQPEPMGAEPISEPQVHIQTMWSEKLKRLRAIIDRIGSD